MVLLFEFSDINTGRRGCKGGGCTDTGVLSNTQLLSTREVSDVEAAREQQGQLATRQGEQQVEFYYHHGRQRSVL